MLNKKRQELIIQNLNSISAEVRAKSIEQLLNFPGMPSEEKIELIQKLLNDSEEEVRSAASAAIGQLSGEASSVKQSPSAFPPVMSNNEVLPSLDAIDTPEERPLTVSESKGVVNDPPLVSQPAPPRNTAFIDDPLDPSLPDIKKINDIPALLDHIKFLSGSKPSGYLTQMLQLAASSLEEVALTALQAIFNLKNNRISSQILAMLAEEQYSSQRRFLMLKIIMDSDQELDCSLLQEILLKERDVIVKSGLVKVFARSSRENGIPTLILCLEDSDPRVRANTVEVIEEQNISGCEQKIIQLLQDPENRVKVNAAKYLVKKGFQQAFLTLRSMLVSPEVWLRDSVIFALGEIGDQASLTLLKAALKDPNQGIRLSVLKALARINNNTARQVLKAACQDPDPVVSQVAASLFDKIKDTPLREEVRQIVPAQPAQPVAAQPSIAQPVQPPKMPVASTPVQTPVSQPVTRQMPVTSPPAAVSVPPAQPVSNEKVVSPGLPPIDEVKPSQPIPAQNSTRVTTVPGLPAAPLKTPHSQGLSDSAPSGIKSEVAKPAVPAAKPQVSAPAPNTSQPSFSKPRSAEIFARLCSENVEEQRLGARDIAFVMGDDQNILLAKAICLADESIRIAAVKVLSRKKTPEAREMLLKLSTDSNETVKSMAEKALQLLK